MPEPEVRYPCPVCLGVKLSKVSVPASQALVLDRCARCGGIWFDEGEVARLRTLQLSGVRRQIRPSESAFRMTCHGCQALMDRNAATCGVCGWKNVLECPLCQRTMTRREVEGWHLDVCTACRGVWFDQIELAEIWNLHVPEKRPAPGRGTTAVDVAAGGVDVVAEVLFWSPDLAIWGAHAVGQGVQATASGVVHVVSEAPEVLGGAVEATGELASTVFEAIAEIVSGIFG